MTNRRKFIKTAAAAAAASSLLSTSAQAHWGYSRKKKRREPHPDPDLILTNGRIHTMDDKNRVVSTVAIKEGKFLEVGSGARWPQGRETTVIDLRGRTVVPGIIDNHNHLVLMGNRPGHHTPLENARSIADVQQTYAARAQSVPAGAWITTIGGFHFNHIYAVTSGSGYKLTGRMPTLAELDAACPNNPVFLMIGFTGPAATNSLGRSILQGQGVTVSDTGTVGQPTAALLYLRQTLLNPETRRRGVIDCMNYAASLGVTTHLDQGAFQAVGTPADGSANEDNYTMHFPFLETYAEGKGIVRLRINFLHMEANADTPELRERLKNAFPFLGDDMVRTGGIGEFIAQGSAAGAAFQNAARKVAAAGWRAEVHSLGRRATATSNPADFELQISAFEAVNAEFPGVIRDKRWVIAHVPGITQEWIDRWQAIGGSLSLTGWQYLAGIPTTSTVSRYNGPPFRMIVDSSRRPDGIHAGMSSDGMQIAPMNPWIHMYYATTGKNARDEVINDGQQITRQEVLSLYTKQNGWFLGEEDQLGSIEEGKLADLVVLNQDYFSVGVEDLYKTRSVLTVVDGEVVYNSGALRWHGDRD